MSNILVVEDTHSIRENLCYILKSAGFAVEAAGNGLEALARIEHQKPDLVVLDVVMPIMNGYELCREIKSNPMTQSIPVVFCTDKRTSVDLHWGHKLGADAYVTKPFEPQELVSTIKQLLK